jgi:hypothetical protein
MNNDSCFFGLSLMYKMKPQPLCNQNQICGRDFHIRAMNGFLSTIQFTMRNNQFKLVYSSRTGGNILREN